MPSESGGNPETQEAPDLDMDYQGRELGIGSNWLSYMHRTCMSS